MVWSTGPAGALEIVIFRMVQSAGGAMLMANSAAILTDAFPHNQRGFALGINGVALLAGSFIGLILGGVLAAVHWRLVFAVNVPFGVAATVWAFLQLREMGKRYPAHIDWLGNLTFALGLASILIGVTYGIKPYGSSSMGWASPFVISMIVAGVALFALFLFVETRVKEPMFTLRLFRIRAFAAGNLAVVLSSIANGGMQFLLIMWLQGIWLPLHGYSFEQTPLWAGIYMLPLTFGYLCAGPLSGFLSDRYGARPFATSGMGVAALSLVLLMALPANFAYWQFGAVIFLNGVGFGLFASPNTAAIMNSVPVRNRGVASATRATCQMLGQPLSTGIFFSLMIAGLAATVPSAMLSGLTAHQVPTAVATQLSQLPPTGYLFAALLGSNPLQQLLGPQVLSALPAGQASTLVSKQFFPSLIGGPFKDGIVYVLIFAAVMCGVAAIASWLRGGKFIHHEAVFAHGHTPGQHHAGQAAAPHAEAPLVGAALEAESLVDAMLVDPALADAEPDAAPPDHAPLETEPAG